MPRILCIQAVGRCAALAGLLLVLNGLAAANQTPGPAGQAPGLIGDPAKVTAAAAERLVAFSGFTRPRAAAPLVAEQAGRVLEVHLDIGDRVPADGRFARLDGTFIRLDLEEIQVQQARLAAQIQYDQREVARYRELAQQRNASASELDRLEQSLRDNRLALDELAVRRRIAEERLARMQILAPAGWRITERQVEPGQWAREGERLGTAADFSTLLVPFALAPDAFAALRQDGAAPLLWIEGEMAPVAARIYRVNPDFDPETRKIQVELALAEPLAEPRGGLRARLELRIAERSGAVTLPAEAVGHSYEEDWLIRTDGDRVPVVRLGVDPQRPGWVRVAAPGLAAGQVFRLQTKQVQP